MGKVLAYFSHSFHAKSTGIDRVLSLLEFLNAQVSQRPFSSLSCFDHFAYLEEDTAHDLDGIDVEVLKVDHLQ
jgi:hypothetical protein